MNKIIVAVDGPAGSGKQRIAKYISKKYNFFHLDSGILYRRLASYLIKNRINGINQDSEELNKYKIHNMDYPPKINNNE